MAPWLEALLKAIGQVLLASADTLYDIIIFPVGKMIYGALSHIPILGKPICATLDHLIERFSQDWTPENFGKRL